MPLKLDSHVAEDFCPALFEELLRFKMEINGFKKSEFCFLEKHADLHQAVTFCLSDSFDIIIQSIISFNDLTVFLKQCVAFG